MKRPSNEKCQQLREELFSQIDAGKISIGRRDYAEKILKISHDALQAVETGKGNPTLRTLTIIGKPFGLDVGFVRKK